MGTIAGNPAYLIADALSVSGGRNTMFSPAKAFSILSVVMLAAAAFAAPAPVNDHGSIIVIFKDGRRQSINMADLSRIDFKAPIAIVFKDGHQQSIASDEIARIEFIDANADSSRAALHRFSGKWEVGDGNGRNFQITLDDSGQAEKSIGETHGTWTVVNGEARITWDDGWHDAIRKVGNKHEKFAYEPGKSFDDKPSNVTEARNLNPKPI